MKTVPKMKTTPKMDIPQKNIPKNVEGEEPQNVEGEEPQNEDTHYASTTTVY